MTTATATALSTADLSLIVEQEKLKAFRHVFQQLPEDGCGPAYSIMIDAITESRLKIEKLLKA